MRPLHGYLLGTGTWFLGVGIQSVLFAWLVTMVLRESPEMVGVAQMTLLLPGTLLILVGGSYADRFGGQRMAVLAQSAGVAAPVLLLCLVAMDRLTFGAMLAYALVIGIAQAFVTPARDGLLNRVASGRVQRTVMQTSIAQFSMQILGFFVASLADHTGPGPILAVQALVLVIGVWALRGIRLPPEPPRPKAAPALLQSMLEGSRTVLRHPQMRSIAMLNVAMSICFMGSYIVTLPLLIREVFDGNASDLGLMNACNAVGLTLALVFMLRSGDVAHQGRAMLIALMLGAVLLGAVALAPTFTFTLVILFFWGACGGIAMTMARTILQERAPEGQRGRIMAISGFTFMGAGPIGALGCGFLVDEFGPRAALGIACAVMGVTSLVVALRSSLWQMNSRNAPV